MKEMKKWLKRICAAVGTGLTWAVVWGFLSVLIGTIMESQFGSSTLLSTVSAVGSARLFRCIVRQQPPAGAQSEECSAHR